MLNGARCDRIPLWRERIRDIDAGHPAINEQERSKLAFLLTITRGFEDNTKDPLTWNPEHIAPEWALAVVMSDPDVAALFNTK